MTTPQNTNLIRQNTSEKDDVCNAACVYFELTFWKIFNYNKLYRLCSLLCLPALSNLLCRQLIQLVCTTALCSTELYCTLYNLLHLWYDIFYYADGLNINIITAGLDFKQLTRSLHNKLKFYHLSCLGDILTFATGKSGFGQKCL